MKQTVGLVGLGIMGGAYARNLLSKGFEVVGFDVDADR
ncbi:MAG: NAD(P)-dependent oxidoreductase, partial [Betaproteobacteria bacterium]|nr:NAD(P)-dependent oxidoreductase [Betaproteobacteria bacterium]